MANDTNWNKRYDRGGDYVAVTTQDVANILSHLESSAPKTALDVGSGTGQLCRELYHRGYKAVGIDGASSAISIAKASTTVASTDIVFVRRDIETEGLNNLPFTPYGLITCRLVLTFIKDKNKLLKDVKSVLAPKGAFIVINPNPDYLPEQKLDITIPHTEALDLLGLHFDVESYERGKDYYYVCRFN